MVPAMMVMMVMVTPMVVMPPMVVVMSVPPRAMVVPTAVMMAMAMPDLRQAGIRRNRLCRGRSERRSLRGRGHGRKESASQREGSSKAEQAPLHTQFHVHGR